MIVCSPDLQILKGYHPPDVFWDEVEHVNNRMRCLRQARHLWSNAYKEFREAWEAGHFARIVSGYGPQIHVRLGTGGCNPDFYLLVDNREWPFEATLADSQERKPAKEYKEIAEGKRPETEMANIVNEDETVRRIAERVKSKAEKARKTYTERRHLLVNVNLLSFGLPSPGKLAMALQSWRHDFLSIWVRQDNRALRVFPLTKAGNASSFTLERQ